jgi:hypothetical protein
VINIELIISIQAAEIYLNDMTGKLSIEAATKKAQRKIQKNLNRLVGLHEIIKAVSGEDDI